MDRHEVAYVVTAVADRRRVERQEPQTVDSEPLEVLELFLESSEVADPVAVRVVKTADRHLVEDRSPVPVGLVLRGRGQRPAVGMRPEATLHARAGRATAGRPSGHGISAPRTSPCRDRARRTT